MFDDCTVDGCDELAIGTGRWQPRKGANPHRPDPPRCRPHHLEAIADRIETWQVVGEHGIVDAVTQETVYAPGLVRLDPAETYIESLRRQKLIAAVERPEAAPQVVEKPAAKAAKATAAKEA